MVAELYYMANETFLLYKYHFQSHRCKGDQNSVTKIFSTLVNTTATHQWRTTNLEKLDCSRARG